MGGVAQSYSRLRGLRRLVWRSGLLVHCGGVFWPCVADNVVHAAYAHRLVLYRRTGWRWVRPAVPRPSPLSPVCRWHDDAARRGYYRKYEPAAYARAQRVRRLGRRP